MSVQGNRILPVMMLSLAFSFPVATTAFAVNSGGLKEVKNEPDPVIDNDPVVVTVSIDRQHLRVFKGAKEVASSNISSGKPGHDTPSGFFSILEKKKRHFSNIYNSAPMPFMQRLTWSGIALHESGSVPSNPASHGCVRLPRKFSQKLYGLTKRGNHVVISPNGAEPRLVAHENLFQPGSGQLALNSLRNTISDMELELGPDIFEPRSGSPLRIYLTRQTRKDSTRDLQEMLRDLRLYGGAIDGLFGRGSIAAVKRFQKLTGQNETGTLNSKGRELLRKMAGRPLLPSGRIYVRQDHEPVFDAPVEIRDPDKPLGSHLFITYRYDPLETQWLAYSVSSDIRPSIVRANEIELGDLERVRTSPEAVLDRIVIPGNARKKIAAMLTEGSSFAISDNGIGTETGKGTDFIVQTR